MLWTRCPAETRSASTARETGLGLATAGADAAGAGFDTGRSFEYQTAASRTKTAANRKWSKPAQHVSNTFFAFIRQLATVRLK